MPPFARASASLDRPAPTPYLTPTFPPRDEPSMALLEILQAPRTERVPVLAPAQSVPSQALATPERAEGVVP